MLAACRSADPDLFFPVSSTEKSRKQAAEAKAVCARDSRKYRRRGNTRRDPDHANRARLAHPVRPEAGRQRTKGRAPKAALAACAGLHPSPAFQDP